MADREAPEVWVRPRTIYLGGGTPTALDPTSLRRLFDWMRASFDLSRVREWTVEANPEGLTDEKLALLREAGADRLSLGMQSLEPAVLKALGRIHTAARALDAIGRVRAAGFQNFGVDLMVAVPGETAEGVCRGVETLVALGVPHLSIYSLQVEEGTPLHAKVARGVVAAPAEDVAAERYEALGRILASAGYLHYEVSNYALPGYEARHNQGYWTRRPYLGLGPGAHSFDGRRRWGNEERVTRYYERVEAEELPRQEMTRVDEARALEEAIFLGLRRARGLRRSAIERAAPGAVGAWERWAAAAGALAPGPPGRLRPTERGMMTAHEVAAELLLRVEGSCRPGRAA
jgi:oxygen-independent coproporphyrinogen-3 oxidase